MLKVVSVSSIRTIEEKADQQGITFDMMFERVAQTCAKYIIQMLTSISDPRIAILVGGGNNGMDGLVTAMQLVESMDHIHISVYMVKSRSKDAKLIQAMQESGITVIESKNDKDRRVLKQMLGSAHLVVDAILGVGFKPPMKASLAKSMKAIQQALKQPVPLPEQGILIQPNMARFQRISRKVIALDCPSGIHCDTGEVDDLAIKADATISFIAAKQGLFMAPAAAHVGELSIATLGITDDNLSELQSEPFVLADSFMIKTMLPTRDDSGHKGTYGKVLIIAGSTNYTGAAGLAAQAAYRSGSGLVTVAAPAPVVHALASHMLEPTWILLPHDMGVLSENATQILLKELNNQYDALLIGPGIGQEDTTRTMLTNLLEQSSNLDAASPRSRRIGFIAVDEHDDQEKDTAMTSLPPLVLDADALNLLAKTENVVGETT